MKTSRLLNLPCSKNDDIIFISITTTLSIMLPNPAIMIIRSPPSQYNINNLYIINIVTVH
jgi:hypothetical protein